MQKDAKALAQVFLEKYPPANIKYGAILKIPKIHMDVCIEIGEAGGSRNQMRLYLQENGYSVTKDQVGSYMRRVKDGSRRT